MSSTTATMPGRMLQTIGASLAVSMALLASATPAGAQQPAVSVAEPLDANEVRVLQNHPSVPLNGTAAQRAAARAVMAALPPGTLVRTRGGKAGELRLIRITPGPATLTDVAHPCHIEWPADYLDFPPDHAPGIYDRWDILGESIAVVDTGGARSQIVLERPFVFGASFTFLIFSSDADARTAYPFFAAWAAACRVRTNELAQVASRIETALIQPILVRSNLSSHRRGDYRRINGLLSNPDSETLTDHLQCGTPLVLYSVPYLTSMGSSRYELGEEHPAFALDRLTRIRRGSGPGAENHVIIVTREQRSMLEFSFTDALAASQFADDLTNYQRLCRIRLQAAGAERSDR